MNRRSGTRLYAREVIPNLILGGLVNLEEILELEPDVLFPLDSLPGDVWDQGFRGEIRYFPIKDYGILPMDVLERLVKTIAGELDAGKRVALFCHGGVGRSGYVAVCLLHYLGIGGEDPIAWLRESYNPNAVETVSQEESFRRFCKKNPPRAGSPFSIVSQ